MNFSDALSLLSFFSLFLGKVSLGAFAWVYFLWIFYLAVMNLMRAKEAKTLSNTAFGFGIPILVVGVVIDVLCNLVICTVLFLEVPKEYTVTKRLGRLSGLQTWRGSVARFVCHNLLDVFDPSGCHCNNPSKK